MKSIQISKVSKVSKVSIGMIFKKNKVLLSSRTGDFMQGFWEFAGGKVEKNETALECLMREFLEEMDIIITNATLLRTITQTYPDRIVELSVFNIVEYTGVITPKEGQKVAWVDAENIDNYKLLPTVKNLLNFATLPKLYWITPTIDKNILQLVTQKIDNGITLVQLRSKVVVDINIVKNIYQLCKKNQVKLMLNIPNVAECQNYFDGVHLTSKQLQQTTQKKYAYMSASTHNLEEVQIAERLGFDFVVLSPIKRTTTHPQALPLGFDVAKNIIERTQIPVYCLGGMSKNDLPKVLSSGGVGIAGISKI